MATQGGVHVYHLLLTYISAWPCLLTTLLTLAASLLCLGPHAILSSLVDMSKVRLETSYWSRATPDTAL